jgi:hypothetical protein
VETVIAARVLCAKVPGVKAALKNTAVAALLVNVVLAWSVSLTNVKTLNSKLN